MDYAFLQHAVFAALFASIVCGLIGTIVVEKNLILMSGGIAHASLGGVGLGYFAGFEPILGAFLFSVSSALGIGCLHRKNGTKPEVLIGLFWSLGMALGILFISLTPGYPPDLTSYLFGNILSVTKSDLLMMLILTAIVTFVVFSLFHAWKAFLFDAEFARILGLWTAFLEYLLLILIAMSVVVLIRAVGIILVIALLTAPAASAALLSANLRTRMILAVLFGMVFCFAGLFLSYEKNIASGATIVIVAVTGYLVLFLLRTIKGKRKAAKPRADS